MRSVVVTSGRERIFCSGANIFMLGLSSHAWKVNFCKFTNETRNGIEDSSRHSGLKFIAACNGTTAGGGYELALACDEILLIDDRSSAVSLPEVPLLGVLPGTGGLTRVTDKRRVRRDHADVFCTLVEGVRAARAKEWRLIDDFAKPQQFADKVRERALALAAASDRPHGAAGVALTPLARTIDDAGYHYRHVDVRFDRRARSATITVAAPPAGQPQDLAAIHAAGRRLVAARDGARARRRDPAAAHQRARARHLDPEDRRATPTPCWPWTRRSSATPTDWFVRETTRHAAADAGAARRHLAHALRADRAGVVLRRHAARAGAGRRPQLHARAAGRQDGGRPRRAADRAVAAELRRLPDGQRARAHRVALLRRGGADRAGAGRRRPQRSPPTTALDLGLVTAAPDDLDWADEIRIALEERASLSPDALTGMEANLRFGGAETMETRVFGRLSAWQNWIFIRPNAIGDAGALKVFGTGSKAKFNWERV